ncbi:derlin-like protein [Gracilaria domingensis]|nr:derlin-like protein [Gracilaria domingensis]
MVYVWGRRNSRQAVGFLGVLNFRAPYLPWVLLLFSFVLGSSPSMDLLGILAGHVYYFMADVYPTMTGNNDDFDDPPFGAVPQEAGAYGNANQGAGWGQGRMLDGGAGQ